VVDWEWIVLGVLAGAGVALLFEGRWERYKARWHKRRDARVHRAIKSIQEQSEPHKEDPFEITQVWMSYDEDTEDNGA
jgi:hypothetical protein